MDKVVWITGANSGIGKSITLKFLRNGHKVVASARREEEIKNILNEEGVDESDLIIVPLDVTDPEKIANTYELLKEKHLFVGLINNAGATSFQNALENSISEIKNIIETNLLGSIYMIKTLLPEMVEAEGGRIINILSVVTNKIFTSSSAYSASKAGLEAYSKVLREEVRENNIRIINIYPGATITPIWPDKALEKFSSRMMNPDRIADIVYDAYSIQENIVPEEIVLRPVKGDL
ncbi:MAG: SDR family NAD(P)-dependent oxidoreductase [Bacteroidetes bacterium]|nr:SDR family NAD(P)-dependent oxidoreductase [Bacteroidota bacterium]